MRFVVVFGVILLLAVAGMAVLAWLLSRWFGGGEQVAALAWVGGCGLVLALPLLALVVAGRAFRGIAAPLADVMEAADAVAAGNFEARVPERGSGEFRQLAKSFNRMAADLQLSDQQRRNLMADVAHELRTPLHIIQGNLEGVLDGVYEPSAEHINATLEETRLLARLVEDLRTLSLVEAGHLPMHWESVDVPELLQDVATSFSGQAEAAGTRLVVEVSGDTASNLVVVGDAGRLDQVIGNLVANALRHTQSGGAIVLDAAPLHPEAVRLTVSDTGRGIPADQLPHIFDRFWSRGSDSGAGLGLAIARRLVEAHGGTISATSSVGQGTTFTIDLPRTPPTLAGESTALETWTSAATQ